MPRPAYWKREDFIRFQKDLKDREKVIEIAKKMKIFCTFF